MVKNHRPIRGPRTAFQGGIDQFRVINADSFRLQVLEGVFSGSLSVGKEGEQRPREQRVIHDGKLESVVLSLEIQKMRIAGSGGNPMGGNGAFLQPVLHGMKSQTQMTAGKPGARIPQEFAIRVHVETPKTDQGFQSDVVGGKGGSTPIDHPFHVRVSHGTVGLIPSADFPVGKMPLPAFQASSPKLIEGLFPQPDVMEDARDQKGLRWAETVSRISPARWL